MATIWIVSLEWNDPPSEVTGDTGIVAVFDNKADADACAAAERAHMESECELSVYNYSMREGRFCGWCGEDDAPDHNCERPDIDEPVYCDHCGAELTETGSCDNDHDEWDIDVHVTEHQIHYQWPLPAPPRITVYVEPTDSPF